MLLGDKIPVIVGLGASYLRVQDSLSADQLKLAYEEEDPYGRTYLGLITLNDIQENLVFNTLGLYGFAEINLPIGEKLNLGLAAGAGLSMPINNGEESQISLNGPINADFEAIYFSNESEFTQWELTREKNPLEELKRLDSLGYAVGMDQKIENYSTDFSIGRGWLLRGSVILSYPFNDIMGTMLGVQGLSQHIPIVNTHNPTRIIGDRYNIGVYQPLLAKSKWVRTTYIGGFAGFYINLN